MLNLDVWILFQWTFKTRFHANNSGVSTIFHCIVCLFPSWWSIMDPHHINWTFVLPTWSLTADPWKYIVPKGSSSFPTIMFHGRTVKLQGGYVLGQGSSFHSEARANFQRSEVAALDLGNPTATQWPYVSTYMYFWIYTWVHMWCIQVCQKEKDYENYDVDEIVVCFSSVYPGCLV